MEHALDIFIRSIFTFACLLILARWMGRKQMAQLTYFDYVTAITIGSIAAEVVVDRKDVHVVEGLFGLALWAAFSVLLNWMVMKNRKVQRLLDGEPQLVIRDGKVLERNLKKIRYTIDDLLEELREKNVFSIRDVQHAIVETDGALSIQLKPELESVQKRDIHIKPPAPSLPLELVMDGQVVRDNLKHRHLSEAWLRKELANRGVEDLSQVMYACLGSDQMLYVDTQNDAKTAPPSSSS
ncbi:MAG: DUF421 domain-containing protein [Tumebacillaceae bacterium]